MSVRVGKLRIRSASLTVVGTCILMAATAVIVNLAGCTKTLDGETYANQKPIVDFINIPPDGQRFSRNPIVYWYGNDPDGLIDYYRYYVVTSQAMGLTPPDEFILTVDDSEWTYIDVVPDSSSPNTEYSIELTASVDDPVNSYVSQFVFLQAYDMEGLGSDIVSRLFARNDHPPETRINDFAGELPFVDGPEAGGVVTGVKLFWSGSDRIDYPSERPPLDYQWRLYGPFTDSVLTRLNSDFVKQVLLTVDGYVYGENDTVFRCKNLECDTIDTVIVAEVISGVDSVRTAWSSLVFKFMVDDPAFIADTSLNKVVDSSFDGVDPWIESTSDTIYNVFKNDPSDTTQVKWFVFWLRSRDDAFVADLVPAFDSLTVIGPKFEREIGVVDLTFWGGGTTTASRPKDIDTVAATWKSLIESWRPGQVEFDTSWIDGLKGYSSDFLAPKKVNFEVPLPISFLLRHKVIVLTNDFFTASGVDAPVYLPVVAKAIEAGVNMWVTMRVPFGGGEGTWQEPRLGENAIPAPAEYRRYFGVEEMVYSGWYCHAWSHPTTLSPCMTYRIEDFVGAYAIDSINWPNLDIDSALLHTRYTWTSLLGYGWKPELAALPEVNWSVRAFETEVLYLYKSLYSPGPGLPANHPLGGDYNMEGNPVAHRLSTTQFRTVHFNFTPIAIKTDQMKQVTKNVLDWLYPEDLSAPVAGVRYPDAPVKVSISESRRLYWERCAQLTKELSVLKGKTER
ncbi:MAG TPA: hypothetical protein VN285_13065 [Candidatus Deferrimicrobium sp.]|nr:hypothetical protein [Candidatus Deferrimicrobium sp.]